MSSTVRLLPLPGSRSALFAREAKLTVLAFIRYDPFTLCRMAKLVRHLPLEQGILGSNPSPATILCQHPKPQRGFVLCGPFI